MSLDILPYRLRHSHQHFASSLFFVCLAHRRKKFLSRIGLRLSPSVVLTQAFSIALHSYQATTTYHWTHFPLIPWCGSPTIKRYIISCELHQFELLNPNLSKNFSTKMANFNNMYANVRLGSYMYGC